MNYTKTLLVIFYTFLFLPCFTQEPSDGPGDSSLDYGLYLVEEIAKLERKNELNEAEKAKLSDLLRDAEKAYTDIEAELLQLQKDLVRKDQMIAELEEHDATNKQLINDLRSEKAGIEADLQKMATDFEDFQERVSAKTKRLENTIKAQKNEARRIRRENLERGNRVYINDHDPDHNGTSKNRTVKSITYELYYYALPGELTERTMNATISICADGGNQENLYTREVRLKRKPLLHKNAETPYSYIEYEISSNRYQSDTRPTQRLKIKKNVNYSIFIDFDSAGRVKIGSFRG